jgi:hypothetical protein
MQVDSSASGTLAINYNDEYNSGASTEWNWHGTAVNFATWQSDSSQDANSIATDPKFTTPASYIYTLQSSSPAIRAGVNLGATYQYALSATASWPSSVTLLPQGLDGTWEIGAFAYLKHCVACDIARLHWPERP